MELDYDAICAPFGFKQLITLIVLKRARSTEPDSDPFVAALERELDRKVAEEES